MEEGEESDTALSEIKYLIPFQVLQIIQIVIL